MTYAGDRTRVELTFVSPDRFRTIATAVGWAVGVVVRESTIYSVRCERAT